MENYTFNIAKFLNQHKSTIRFTVIFETNIKDLFLSDQKKKRKKKEFQIQYPSLKIQILNHDSAKIYKDQQITHKNQSEFNCIAIRSEKSEKSPLKNATATYLQQNKEKETIYNTRIRYDRAKKAVKIHETPRKRGKLK